ncbi:MAG: exodeoxyribonuclease V subunit beta, partial [Desulfatiglandales bacterium]
MKSFKPFDLLNAPLEGVNLIEASAGTGKTYAMIGLILRLILERGLDIQDILVVTFTEAATAELRDRLRRRLREGLEAFLRGGSEDVFLDELVRRHGCDSRGITRLREAVRGFDRAAVFTIHGFCRRVLQENAFESGILFDTELVTDQEELKRDIVDDFWRRHFYEASPMFVAFALEKGFSPGDLLGLLSNRVSLPYLEVVPQWDRLPDPSNKEGDYLKAFSEVKGMWPSAREEVATILCDHKDLSRVKYGIEKIPVWVNLMDAWLSSGPFPLLFMGFEKFTKKELEGSLKKGGTPPEHPFFRACEALRSSQEALETDYKERLLALKSHLFSYVRQELGIRKQERNVQSFDDLLTGVKGALAGDGGPRLSRLLGLKFKVALIDEFQDTDPVQYAIFRTAFGRAKNGLFLIGDPKQAIYGFRGADIFTYIQASRDAGSMYTLGENWRSEPALIQAVNTIFKNNENPFVFNEIPFEPATPAEGGERMVLRVDGREEEALHLWYVDARKHVDPGKPISKNRARDLIPEAVAGEISRLVRLGRDHRVLLNERSLQAGDIAVLVRTNAEARLVQSALSALHIPSVLQAGGDLFDSHEAQEMERVLAVVTEPGDEALLRAALATDLLGVSGESLELMAREGTLWERRGIRFRAYHDLWKERGFIQMFRALLSGEGCLERLMGYGDGERRTTNLLHIGEVLHRVSVKNKTSMTGLLKWLAEQRDADNPGRTEHPLRLESDENAVKLVTTHKSKGLEYPVVFCPFHWGGSRVRQSSQPVMFHDDLEDMKLTLDLGSEDMARHRVLAENEILAENLRLLYVGLTRAKCRCYLVWGRFNESETSAPAYLFYPPGPIRGADIVGATGEHVTKLSDDALFEAVERLAESAGKAVRLVEMPEGEGEKYRSGAQKSVHLSHRAFSGKVDRRWGLSSFSSLTSGPIREEATDWDSRGAAEAFVPGQGKGEEKGGGLRDIFSFPGGTKAGLFFHDIFEHLDFRSKGAEHKETLVTEKLRAYGFDDAWRETVVAMINRVLALPLDPALKDLRLSNIGHGERLNELEFTFPLRSLSPKDLRSLFSEETGRDLPCSLPETIGALDFAPTRGFMRGFVDLVFLFRDRYYLVDWKSNILGKGIGEYGPEGLNRAMAEGLYTLQYLIYALALDQYLRLRLPGYDYEKSFGGVFYIFLRGVEPERSAEYGIYRARPSAGLIHLLHDRLIDEEAIV